jgi:hypothetical protein
LFVEAGLEWCRELTHEVQRIIGVEKSQITHAPILGQKPAAEDEVPNDEVVPVVAIRLLAQL